MNRLKLLLAAVLVSGWLSAVAGGLPKWSAADGVPADVERSMFAVREIPADVAARMRGKSYPDGCPVPLSQLRYLQVLHHTGRDSIAVGEMVCNRAIADDLIAIFRNLYKAGYPIERMELIDDFGADDEQSMRANNTSCFNYRPVSCGKKLSKHAYGMAVDINPLYNPYIRMKQGGRGTIVQPANGRKYADRSLRTPYRITAGDRVYREFIARGFRWGGNWRRTKDYQHFDRPVTTQIKK